LVVGVLGVAGLLSGCATGQRESALVYFPPPPAVAHAVHLVSFNSLDELAPTRPSFLDVLRGPADFAGIEGPGGLACANGALYVCDRLAGVVERWQLETGKKTTLGRGVLSKPVAVAVAEGGTVLVADPGLGEVVAFDAVGAVTGHWKPAQRESYQPVAIALAGATAWVADAGNHALDRFNLTDGTHQGTVGAPGKEPGQFAFPSGLAIDAGGRVVVADTFNSRVQVLGPDGSSLKTFGQAGDRYGDMGKPRQLAVGPDGVIFIADATFAHVHLFDGEGRLLMLLGGPQHEAGGTPLPFGVAVAPTLPDRLTALVPDNFQAQYYLFVSNTVGTKRLSLFAVGLSQ